MMPRLSAAGLLVAGDAAGFCYTNGLTTEGMNLAMTSGLMAAQVGAEALAAGDVSAEPPRGATRSSSDGSFVLRDLKTFRNGPSTSCTTTGCSRVYPQVVSALMEGLYRSDGVPKQRIARLGLRRVKGRLSLRRLVADAVEAGRCYL